MTLNNSEEKVILPTGAEKSEKDKSLCPVCSAPSLCSCRTCKKISYCSKAHQRSHWKQHKSDCYPLMVQEDEFLGCRLIATRNIRKGEVILREKPLLVSGSQLQNTPISSPSEEEAQETILERVVCLGCFNIVKTDNLCSTCLWSVCGPGCEKTTEHHENECKIFASCKQQPFQSLLQESKYKYEAIIALRGVLLKENDPIKWQKIKDLEKKLEEKRDQQTKIRIQDLSHFCTKFIQDQCTLAQYSEEDIDSVLKVLSTEGFEVYDAVKNYRNGLHLYHIASFADQNCTPNSSWRIQPNSEIYLRAMVPISFGERVSISHTDVIQGTAVRQKQLQRSKCFNCTCERCTSPTELGTFFSAIKCPCDSSEGYLIQNSTKSLLPTEFKIAEWRCNDCGEKKDLDFCEEILTSFKTDMSSINISSDKNSFESAVKLAKLNQHLGVTLHPNHFQVYSIEMEILKTISNELDVNHWSSRVDEKLANLVEKFITLSQKWLTVADVLWPGFSEQRGLLLNFLQQGLTMSLIIIISMNMKKKKENTEILEDAEEVTEKQLEKEFVRILQIRKEILEIFCLDLEGNPGRRIADLMAHEGPEIKILRKRFHCVLNGN